MHPGITHQASHSISYLLKPSKLIAPTESSNRGDYATQGDYQSRGQCPDPTHSEGHHISTGPYHYLIISLFFVFTYYISIHNSMFWCLIFWDWMYYWWYIIYRHHFCLNLAFFYFLYSLNLLFFLKHVVSPIRLRLHATQEVPLPPFIFLITLETLRTMFSLVGRRVEEGSFVINAKLFW